MSQENRLNFAISAVAIVALGAAVLTSGSASVWAQSAPPPTLPSPMPQLSGSQPKGDGIALSGLPPTADLAMPALTNDPAQIEAQAEEAAARAAAEEARRAEDFKRKSYDRASSRMLPLSSEQIRDFMKRLESVQQAAQAPSAGPPKGASKVVSLSLDPGTEPPTIRLAGGYVTTIDVLDLTGAPWPILDVGVGGNFEVTPTQAGSHVVRVTPLTRLATGNLSILLKDLSTPVIFRLAAGGDSFDMRYDVQLPRLGPNAKPPLIDRGRTGPLAGDQTLMMVLENAPPSAAKKLRVAGLDARSKAWQLGEKVYLRTPLTLLSPAWNASAASTDGMTVYEIGDAPVLLMSDNGAMVRARLTRDEDHDK